MKRILTSILMLLLLHNAFAQGFYVRGGIGYAFPLAGEAQTSITHNTGSVSYQVSHMSYSTGFQGALAAGYMFNEHVGLDLSAIVGIANKKNIIYNNNDTSRNLPFNEKVIQYATTPVVIIPAVIVQSGGSRTNVYARAGIALPLNTKTIQQDVVETLPGYGYAESDIYTYKNKSYFGVGVAGAVGIQNNVSRRVTLWAEANYLSLSVDIKEGDLTNLTVNGVSYLSSYSGTKSLKFDKNNTYAKGNSYSAAQQPTYTLPFSSVGIHAGVAIRFPEKAKDSEEKKPGRRYKNR